jgi:hypothetical protein
VVAAVVAAADTAAEGPDAAMAAEAAVMAAGVARAIDRNGLR